MQRWKCQHYLVSIYKHGHVGIETSNELDELPKAQVISLTRPKLIYISSGELCIFRIPSQDTSSLFAMIDASPLSM